MTFRHWIELAGHAVEGAGVAVLVIGVTAVVVVGLVRAIRGNEDDDSYRWTRKGLGRVILLGLEILVAGDIIATVAVEPTLRSVGVLAGIVLIRTFLSWAIELEIEGRIPWRPRSSSDAT